MKKWTIQIFGRDREYTEGLDIVFGKKAYVATLENSLAMLKIDSTGLAYSPRRNVHFCSLKDVIDVQEVNELKPM